MFAVPSLNRAALRRSSSCSHCAVVLFRSVSLQTLRSRPQLHCQQLVLAAANWCIVKQTICMAEDGAAWRGFFLQKTKQKRKIRSGPSWPSEQIQAWLSLLCQLGWRFWVFLFVFFYQFLLSIIADKRLSLAWKPISTADVWQNRHSVGLCN